MNMGKSEKKVCQSVDISSPVVNRQKICLVNGVSSESIESGNQNKPIYTSSVGLAINGSIANGRLSLDNPNTSSSHTLVSCDKAGSPRLSNLLLTTPILNDSLERESYDVELTLPVSQCPQENASDNLVLCREPLQGLVAFVDVRSNHDNRSEGVADVLEKLGAIRKYTFYHRNMPLGAFRMNSCNIIGRNPSMVERKLTSGITHVIFSNGRQSTVNFAEKHDVFLVSVLWVESCLQNHRRVEESLFPASRNDTSSPTRSKMNRLKSMQPKAFDEEMKNSGKLEERRRKRNNFREKKHALPFELISLEDMETDDISKKMQEHDSFFNSPIASNSPFLDHVMKRLSEKRASMEGSPECTKKNHPTSKNTTNGNETKENGKFDNQHDDVFFSESEALYDGDPCDLVTKNGSQLEGRPGIDANNVEKFNSEKALKETKLISCNTTDDTTRSTISQCDKIVVKETCEDEVMNRTSNSIIAGPNFCSEDDDSKMIQAKAIKVKRKKLLSKNQILNCSIIAEITAASNSTGLDNVKKIEKLKRKRKQENTSRKRRKGIANDKEGKCTEAVEDKVARNHCCSIENVESENQGVVEIEKIQAAEVKEKATLQSRSLPEVTSPRRNVVAKGSLVMTSMHYGQQEFIRNVVKKLGVFSIAKTVNSKTTHVVAGNSRRTLNILNAIVHGCWIVSPNWVSDSYDHGEWLNEEEYELNNEFPSAKQNRCAKLEKGTGLSNLLFEKLDPIFVAENTVPPKFELAKLIRRCGGQVTANSKQANICVGDSADVDLDCRMVDEKWILDSVMKMTLLDVDEYIIDQGNSSLTF